MLRPIQTCPLLLAVPVLLSALQQPQSPTAHKNTPPPPATAQPEMMPMPLVAPLFVENGEFSSLVTIVNGAAATATADVVLFDQQGAQVLKKTLSLNGHSQQALKLGDLLQAANANVSVGSVEIMPETKAAQSMSVVAQLSIVNNSTSPSTYLEEEFLMPTSDGSNKYQAAAISVIGSPVLALMSTSANPQSVTISCLPERGAPGNLVRTVQLAPAQMALTDACDPAGSAVLTFNDAWHQADSSNKGAVGLSVTTNGKSGDLAVYGFAARGERNHPAFTAINFIDPGMLRSNNTVFTGVPVGQADLLPGGTFKPEIAVSNFSSQPASVSVLYATTDETGTRSNTLTSATVPPQASRSIELSSLTGDASMRNSFIIRSTAPPGTLAANLIALDRSTSTTVQLIGKDQKQVPNSGAHPWTTADGMTSTLLFFNHSDADQSFDVNISAKGVFWQQQYKLAAKETKSLSINDLIARAVKDKKGNVIPKDATTGEVGWSVPKISNGVGRLLISKPDISLARSFSCGTQDVECGLDLSTYALDMAVNGTGTFLPAYTQYCLTCWPNCGACTGTYDYDGGGGGISFNSENTSIATIDDYGTVTGQFAGTTGIDFYGDESCVYESGQATVHNPSYMVVVNDMMGICENCSSTVLRDVTYSVKNDDGSSAGKIALCESASATNWTCSQSNPGVGYVHCGDNKTLNATTSDGEFTDSWYLGSDNYTPSGCGLETVADMWQWDLSPTQPQQFGKLNGYIHTTDIKINGSVTPPQSQRLPNGTCISNQGTVPCPH